MSESGKSKSKGEQICDCCGESGARKKCKCKKVIYCDKKCQKKHWKPTHREECTSRKVKPNISVIKEEEEEEEEDLCPICMDNVDDAIVDGAHYGMCTACGQSYCGACNTAVRVGRSPNCPTCRAPFYVSDEEDFKRCWKLVHDRSPGRHTPVAQNNLGVMYDNGEGVEQDHVEAAKLFRKAAEAGRAKAQYNLGYMYRIGKGVEQDDIEAAKWYRKAAEAEIANAQFNLGIMYGIGKGVEQDFSKAVRWLQLAGAQAITDALTALDDLQQANFISTPPPGTRIKLILLTSPKTSMYNNLVGKVDISKEPIVGKVPILLDDSKYPNPLAFKLKFVQIIEE